MFGRTTKVKVNTTTSAHTATTTAAISISNNNDTTQQYQQLGNDLQKVLHTKRPMGIKRSGLGRNSSSSNNNSCGRKGIPAWLSQITQKCCWCCDTKRTVMGVNTSNIGIATGTGMGTSRNLDETINAAILSIQAFGSFIGITGAAKDNICMIAICTIIYSLMAIWCCIFLLDVPTAVYYAGIAYPNYLLIEELRNGGIDVNYQEDEMDDNENRYVAPANNVPTTTITPTTINPTLDTNRNHHTINSSSPILQNCDDVEKQQLHELRNVGTDNNNNMMSTNINSSRVNTSLATTISPTTDEGMKKKRWFSGLKRPK
jgi:hypothetical protein